MRLNVLYSSNDKYVSIAGISIISMLENNQEFDVINIYYIDCGLSNSSINILQNVVKKYKRILIFLPLNNIIKEKKINVPNKSYYGRFFGCNITEDDKILYLDCDLIIEKSLKTLWEIDLEDYYVAGVQGPGASFECRKKINISSSGRYINTGVLLINLRMWRKYNIEDKLLTYLEINGEIPPYHDQNIINAVCWNNTLIINPKYNLLWSMLCCSSKYICKLNQIENYYENEEIEQAKKNPVIVHFSNSIYGRPWIENCSHMHRNLYYKYKEMSPWVNEKSSGKNISIFRLFRYYIYRNVPSFGYYLLQKLERYIISKILPLLKKGRIALWIESYMNGM